jgi:hypothetical protein
VAANPPHGPPPREWSDPDAVEDPLAEVGPIADIEAPEADALEQAEVVGDPPRRPVPPIGVEVPEADALEQAMEVPLVEDDDLR